MDLSRNPYVFYFFSLVIGVFLCEKISISILYLCFLQGALLFFLAYMTSKINYRKIFSLLILGSWCLIGIVVGKLNNDIANDHYIKYKEKGHVQYITVIIKEQNNSNKQYRKYTAEVKTISYKNQRNHTSGAIMLLVDKEKFNSVFTLGNEYVLKVTLSDPITLMNPHQFNYAQYLKRNYILQIAKVDKIISESAHYSLVYMIKNFNQNLITKIESSSLSEDSKEFLKAYLLGDRSEMKKESIDAYSKSGIMHLIAISGMHIAFIFGIIFSLLSWVLKSGNRKIIILTSLSFVWFFGCLVGLSSSVFRSCLMITIYYLFELLKRTSNIYHSMALSAIIILLCDPNEIYSVGFQLSYIAVFFISWLSPSIYKYMKVKNKRVNEWILNPLAVTIAAQIGTLPFVLFYFHQFSLLSIPINILIIPYTFVITYSSLGEIFLVFLPLEYQTYPTFIYDFLVKILVDTTYYISSMEKLMFKNISLNLMELLFLTSALIFLKNYLYQLKIKTIFPFFICVICFQLSILYNDFKLSSKKSFIVFNHSNTLLGFRNGKKLLIIGSSSENWEKVKRNIIDPYTIGERISSVQYKTLQMNTVYKWERKKILVLNKPGKNNMDSANYIITDKLSIVKEPKNPCTIIFTGNKIQYADGQNYKSPSNHWITSRNGAFICSL